MSQKRKVKAVFSGRPVIEGAGVKLRRVFGHSEVPHFDPFLLLDDFHSGNPADYMAGFPWHPHRGIETVTYMIDGSVAHGDSLGNSGTIGPGDVQWMTAGSGIIHREMPKKSEGFFQGFQLWVNLPARNKMMPPRYREVKEKAIPHWRPEEGVTIRLIAGTAGDLQGPVKDLIVPIEYLDIQMDPEKSLCWKLPANHTAIAYVFTGEGCFDAVEGETTGSRRLLAFTKGDDLEIRASDQGIRFLLISGPPLKERVAWQGPIVMNTEEELDLAFDEFRGGTFIK